MKLHSLSKQENNFFRFYFLCQKIATQVKDYKIGICCISAKHVALRTGGLGIRIMCQSEATCLSTDCCFSELAL